MVCSSLQLLPQGLCNQYLLTISILAEQILESRLRIEGGDEVASITMLAHRSDAQLELNYPVICVNSNEFLKSLHFLHQCYYMLIQYSKILIHESTYRFVPYGLRECI